MVVRRVPPIFLVYVGLTVAQAVVFLLINGGVSGAGIPFELFLLGGLAYGQPWAYWILVVINTLGLAAVVLLMLGGDGHLLVGNAVAMLASTGALEATLLSAPMRRHVQARGLALRRRLASS